MTDFSIPQRMSFGAFFIYFLKYFRLTFNAVVIYLAYEVFRSDSGLIDTLLKITAMMAGTAVLALILAAMAYFQIKFHVEDGNLIYRHRLIGRATTTIPLRRIHTLRTRKGLIYRMVGLRGVLFDTLAAKGEEIELILSESDWQSLLGLIERQEQPTQADPSMPPVYKPSSSIKFSNKMLLLDALCQNHLKGMVVLGGFVAVIFNSLSDLPESTIEIIASYLESHFGYFAVSLASIAMIMAFTYVVSLVLWLGKVLLRYYDLSLVYDSEMLSFSHGLLSRLGSRFAHDKICTIRIKRNYLEKRFGLCTLALKQALNAGEIKDEDNLKIYGQDSADFFLSWWLGKDYGKESDEITAKSGKGVLTHSLLPDLLIFAAATAALWHFGFYGWICLPAIYLLAGIPKGILAMRHSYITIRESYIIIGNGRFAEIQNYLKFSNVEVVRITRTPLSRFTGRVSLSLSSTGSTFSIRSLRYDKAIYIYEQLLAESTGGATS